MTQTRKITPGLIERLRREQQNAWGNVTLDDIAVQCRYGEETITIELQIEPEIIMHGQADKLAPGVGGVAPGNDLVDDKAVEKRADDSDARVSEFVCSSAIHRASLRLCKYFSAGPA